MLGNNEQIQGINLSDVFAQMVSELPWSSLLAYIQANAPVQKLCTIGGHRLVPDKRKRFEAIIVREAEKYGFSEAVTNGVFASWYPVHAELHQQLEDYYHSDEYKEYREKNGLDEEEYVLPDDKMDAMFKLDDLKLWKIILCFSPLKFTKEQADRLLHDTTGNEELVERLKSLQESSADMTRKFEQMTAEVTKARARQTEDAAEIADLKKQLRQLRMENEATQKKLETAQAEARRAVQQLSQMDSQNANAETTLRNEMQRNVARVQNELDRVSKELQSWQSRYEEQRASNREKDEAIAALSREKETLKADFETSSSKVNELQSVADLILSRIDWPRIGSSMKLSPTMRRNFNSLVKKLDYEEDRSQTIEGTLPEFWGRLNEAELKLVDAIAKSNMNEVLTGDIASYWNGLKDSFADVQTSLEARIVLLGMLQDIFYQTIEMDDLNDAILAKSKTKKKTE